MPPLKIAVAGALGRMGRQWWKPSRLIRGWRWSPGSTGPASRARAWSVGRGAGRRRRGHRLHHAGRLRRSGRAGAARGGPALVIGSTGFDEAELAAIAAAAKRVAIVRAGNLLAGAQHADWAWSRRRPGRSAADDYDIEVFEAHHRHKVDAPSGTALMLGEAAAEGRGVELAAVARRVRDGITGARPQGEIGFSVLRGGGIVGEHSVIFAAEDEILTLSHSARDRGLFARGAVAAARWVAGRPPGEYDMQDVLGFNAS